MQSNAAFLPDWDAEEARSAMEQARRLSARDPEASGHLLAQLAALPDAPVVDSYNPTELYAVLALECHWTPQQIDGEHYPRLFRLVREITRIREQQKEQQDRQLVTPS